ncbi:MAG: M56 family metallopeptidase [Chthoniobacteraceae bacterium]
MNAMDGILFLTKCFEWLLRSSWQGAVLIVAVLLVQTALRRRLSARWRFNLWFLVLARLLLPFSPESALSVFNFVKPRPVVHFVQTEVMSPLRSTVSASTGASAGANDKPAAAPLENHSGDAETAASPSEQNPSGPVSIAQPKRTWSALEIASLTWLAGVLGLSLYVMGLAIRTRRRIGQAVPVQDPAVVGLFDECRGQMGVRASVRLMETAMVKSPALCGVFRSSLLLPPGLTSAFSSRELRYIFLHELAHFKRRDVLINWLVTALQIAHWFNPFVWYGFARMRADRELACDALAMGTAREEEAKEYGRTVIKLLETLSRPSALPGLVGIMEDKRQMERRIRMIAAFKKTRRWSIPALIILTVLAITGLTDAVKPKEGQLPKPDAKDTMTLTVMDAETGAPVQSAGVIIGYSPDISFHQAPKMIVTDANGIAEVPREGIQNSTKGLGVQPTGYAPKAVTWAWGYPANQKPPKYPDIPKQYTVKLQRGGGFGGIVRDEIGNPIPGARVEIKGSTWARKDNVEDLTPIEYPFFDTFLSDCPVTDADGRWRCDHFPEQIEYVEINLMLPDNSCTRFHTEEAAGFPNAGGQLVEIATLQNQTARMVFPKGVKVRGVVVDPEGQPIKGITLIETDRRSHSKPLAKLTTGSDGRFELPNRDPHQILIKASGAGYAINPAVVNIEAGMPEVRIVMNRQAPLRIRVVDESGRPIANARMGLVDSGLEWSAETGADGRLVWDEAPQVPTTYGVGVKDYGETLQRITPDGREHTVVLRKGTEPSCFITVRAETQTKEPVPSFTVSSVEENEQTEIIGKGENGVFIGLVPLRKINSSNTRLKVEAQGFVPFTTGPTMLFATLEASVTLTRAISGPNIVFLPDGTPAAKARLLISTDPHKPYFRFSFRSRSGIPEESSSQIQVIRTDDAGHFSLPENSSDQPVIITHKDGFLETSLARLRQTSEVRLHPWGRMEGTLTENGKPKPDQRLELLFTERPDYYLAVDYYQKTDLNGHFVFDKVPPGDCTLACTAPSKGTWSRYHVFPVKVAAGETTKVDYANVGRAVTGKLTTQPEAGIDWQKAVTNHLLAQSQPRRDRPEPPAFADFVRQEDYRAAFEKWQKSLSRPAKIYESFNLEIETDGSFHVDAVPPGTYAIEVSITDPDHPKEGHWQDLGSLKKEVVIPPVEEKAADTPVDLGTLVIPTKMEAQPKEPAKPLLATAMDGSSFDLTSLRGKYALVVFWAPWAPPSDEEVAALKAVEGAFGANPHFAIVGVAVEDNAAAVEQCPQVQGIAWTGTQLKGRGKTTTTEAWGVNDLPSVFLIGPDGNIAVRNLKSARLQPAVEAALKSNP